MTKPSPLAALLLLAAMQLSLAAPASARVISTPPPTSSDECPDVAVDTNKFLSGSTIAVRAPRGPLALVVVDTDAAKERGLMCVVRIPHGRGMLFVFAPPDTEQGFWMKNTLVPLDMVFVRGDGVVSNVAVNVPATPRGTPDDKVARAGGLGRFVIELGAGDAARLGIAAGTKLAIPPLQAKE